MKSSTFLSIGTLFFSLAAAVPNAESLPVADSSEVATSGKPILPFGTAPIPLSKLAKSFPPPSSQDASSIEAIRNTLALYAFAIDGKNFDALSNIFTTNVVTNYSAPLNVLTPLSTVQSVLSASLVCVTTQHSYGTQLISIRSSSVAFSVTYYRAVHFGTGALSDQTVEAFGQYQDTWQKQRDGTWRIVYRNLVYMGPVIGNFAIFVC